MLNELSSIILATLVVSAGSLIGIAVLALNQHFLSKILLSLVSLSAGTMLGAAFLHLLPESVELLEPTLAFQIVLGSFITFFLLERILHWRHCHDEHHLEKHTLGTMNLIGDAVHNFLDGLLIAASFAAGEGLGLAASVAIIMHEVPQEIGDFGVLLHSGYSRGKALLFNLMVSLFALLGGVVGYFLIHRVDTVASFLIPVAAGGFIYIGASDLIPELKNHKTGHKIATSFVVFLLGIALMALVKE